MSIFFKRILKLCFLELIQAVIIFPMEAYRHSKKSTGSFKGIIRTDGHETENTWAAGFCTQAFIRYARREYNNEKWIQRKGFIWAH